MTHESLSWFIPLIMVYSTECIFFTHFFTLPPSLGTYNNQYMIVDMGKVTLGHSIEDGALTVVEQIPGLVEFSDQTRPCAGVRNTDMDIVLPIDTHLNHKLSGDKIPGGDSN